LVWIENSSRIGDKKFWISYGWFYMDPEEQKCAEAAQMAVISDNVI
jgi:hypothetical protein